MNLITRLDFDGILCAAMIHEIESIRDISFSDPKTIEEGGLLDILQRGDVVAHLPFHSDAGIWFHNHDVSHINPERLKGVKGKYGVAPSTARQVYEYYNSPVLQKYEPLVKIADKIGSANLDKDDIISPTGWVLVSCTLDPRFSHDHSYGILILNSIKGDRSAEEVLALPPVTRRVELYKSDEKQYLTALKEHTKLYGNIIITDFRGLDHAPRGNRFVVFVEYEQGNVHVRLESLGGFRTKVSVSKSILNRTSKVNVGRMLEDFGGGGPEGAGTCIFGRKTAEDKIVDIINKLKD